MKKESKYIMFGKDDEWRTFFKCFPGRNIMWQ